MDVFRDTIALQRKPDLESVKSATKQMKILFIGNLAVGKSSIVQKICENKFIDQPHDRCRTINFVPTIMCAEFERTTYLVELQDTAGQEKFNSIFTKFWRHAHGAVVVYDIRDYDSYERIKFWMVEVQKHAVQDPKFPFLLLGNKIDGNESDHIDGSTVAERLGMSGFIKTSAKSGEGIEEAIKMMIGLIATRYSDQELEIPYKGDSIALHGGNTDSSRYRCILRRIRIPWIRRPRVS